MMKIWMKNFFYTTIIIIFISFISLSTLYFFMPKYYTAKLQREAKETAVSYATYFNNKPIDKIVSEVEKIEDLKYGFKLLNSQNRILAQSLFTMSIETIDKSTLESLQSSEDSESSIEQDQKKFMNQLITHKESFTAHDGKNYYLAAEIFSQPITDASVVLLELSPYIVLISIIIGLIIAFFYSKFSTKRITQVSEITRKMVHSDKPITINISGNDEISDLSQNINFLNNELKQTIHSLEVEIQKVASMEKSKQYFVQSAAHELKTPLSIMSGLIEGMLLNLGKYKDHDTYLKKCQELIEKQSELIQEITNVYHLSNTETVHLKPLAIGEIIEECIQPYLLVTEQSGKNFNLNLSDSTELGNKEDLNRLLSNVLNNAFSYSFDNSPIDIQYISGKITIENKCTPLTNDELNYVFEPFYRPDFSRSRNDGGTGLGLFFVKELAKKYHYSFEFKPSNNEDGMIFILYFN